MPRQAERALQRVQQSLADCGALFHALGDPQRQAIVLLLSKHERLNVGAITAAMTLSRPAVSHHLKVLRSAGLLSRVRESRENFYSLEIDAALAALRDFVEHAQIACV